MIAVHHAYVMGVTCCILTCCLLTVDVIISGRFNGRCVPARHWHLDYKALAPFGKEPRIARQGTTSSLSTMSKFFNIYSQAIVALLASTSYASPLQTRADTVYQAEDASVATLGGTFIASAITGFTGQCIIDIC